MNTVNEAMDNAPPQDVFDERSLKMAEAFFGVHHPLFSAMHIGIGRVEKGAAEMHMPFGAQLADDTGALHRGALVTLLDTTCGLAIFAALGTFRPIATVDLRVDYLREINPGAAIRAHVECVGMTEHMAYIQGRVTQEPDAAVLAIAAGSFALNTMGPAFGGTERGGTERGGAQRSRNA